MNEKFLIILIIVMYYFGYKYQHFNRCSVPQHRQPALYTLRILYKNNDVCSKYTACNIKSKCTVNKF